MSKVVHLTSVHDRSDVRIFWKECRTLATRHSVFLIVADGKGDQTVEGIHILDVGKPTSRLRRMLFTRAQVLRKALQLNGDVYHFHDPELLPVGRKLKFQGKVVIYDVHEDVPRQILGKRYIPKLLRSMVSKIFEKYENSISAKLSGLVTSTPHICNRFKSLVRAVAVQNFPLLEEMTLSSLPVTKKNQICYIGGIDTSRGILPLVAAMEQVKAPVELVLAGKFFDPGVEQAVRAARGFDKTQFLGFLNRSEVVTVLAQSKAGLVTLLPQVNYLDSLPVKMFEYMAMGVPVIASDFPLWKDIVERNSCGICVNPSDSVAIAKAIDFILSHPEEAHNMGKNGERVVRELCNWTIEGSKLLRFYEDLGVK